MAIEYAGEGTVVQNSAVYEKFSLPQDTLSILPSTNNGGVSVARIAFSDANGVISEIPAAGSSVKALASVVNNTAQDKEAILWVGMYQGDRLLNVKTAYAKNSVRRECADGVDNSCSRRNRQHTRRCMGFTNEHKTICAVRCLPCRREYGETNLGRQAKSC